MSEDREERRGERQGQMTNDLVMTSLCFIQSKSMHGLPESVPHGQ